MSRVQPATTEQTQQTEQTQETLYPETQTWSREMKEAYLESPTIRRLLHKLLKSFSSTDAAIGREDLRQEAKLAIWRALGTYDPSKGARLTTFLHQSARNAMAMAVRPKRAQRRTPLEAVISLDLAEAPAIPAKETTSMLGRASQREIVDVVFAILRNKCTPLEREIFLMLAKRETTQTALAKTLGCSQGKVSVAYRKIKERLREELALLDIDEDSVIFS